MEKRLDTKVAIVTGSGQGIGKAVALRLAHEGADIAIADLNSQTAEQTAREIRAGNQRSLAYPIDLADINHIKPMVEKVRAEFGRIDILVNAAGIIEDKLFLELTERDWDRVIDINLKAMVFCIQAVAAQMVRQVPDEVKIAGRAKQSYGKIVNFSSISGRRGRDLHLPYAASKAAIISITQSTALALAKFNINVNAVAPGIVPTPMWQQIDIQRGRLLGTAPGEPMKAFIEKIPLKRAGSPEDIAGVVAFLCSADSDYMTGQTLNVDGGYEMD